MIFGMNEYFGRGEEEEEEGKKKEKKHIHTKHTLKKQSIRLRSACSFASDASHFITSCSSFANVATRCVPTILRLL